MKQMLHGTYPPESSTLVSELAGFRINVMVVLVFKDFEDLTTGRRKLLATTTVYRGMHVNILFTNNSHLNAYLQALHVHIVSILVLFTPLTMDNKKQSKKLSKWVFTQA